MKAYAKVEAMEGTFYTRKSVKGVIFGKSVKQANIVKCFEINYLYYKNMNG